jgi:hypothetical protein
MFKRQCESLFSAKALFVLAMFFLMVSCATTAKMYSGPDLPANEVAFIQSATCDGKKIAASRAAVMPGEHLIEMSFNQASGDWVYWSANNAFFYFTAEAGHTYSVDWKLRPNNEKTYAVVLKDQKTGQDAPYKQGKPRQPLVKNNPGRFLQLRNPNNPNEFIQIGFPNETACRTFLSFGQKDSGNKDIAEETQCSAESLSVSLPFNLKMRDALLNTVLKFEFASLNTCKLMGRNTDKMTIVESCTCGKGTESERKSQTLTEIDSKTLADHESGRYFQFTGPLDLEIKAQFDLQSELNCTNFLSWVKQTNKKSEEDLLKYVGCNSIKSSVSLPYKAGFKDKKQNVTFDGYFVTSELCRIFTSKKDNNIEVVAGCRLDDNARS